MDESRTNSQEHDGRGPTLEQFALEHHLPPKWLELRGEVERIVCSPAYWYETKLQDRARAAAAQASDILKSHGM